ncbi:MAG: hypothetical protein QME57_04145, partial [Patescibacteria group bacterium]|nr:hypothetical protein [Patescibacteria group bacterium]
MIMRDPGYPFYRKFETLPSGLLKIEFCDCSQCKKIYSMFLSRARRKGDYDVDTWKEIHTQDLNGKIFPMTDIVKICASHQEENEGEKHTKDIPKQSEATPEIPHGKRKCPQCKSKNTDMDAKTHIQHCLDCGAAWEYIVRHRLHMIQKGTK